MKIPLPENYWDFVMDYLPNYSSRDDVLKSDIFQRYIDGEDVCEEDIEYFFKGKTMEEIEKEHYEDDLQLLLEALENFIKEHYPDN